MLAREMSYPVHSAEAALDAEAEFNQVFKENQIPDDIPGGYADPGRLRGWKDLAGRGCW